jgi:dipeptidyl aminopeptidase/acylaminoacyl peptidase
MNRLGVPSLDDDEAPSDIAHYSPDGKMFAIVMKKGNLRRNANDYSLLVFRTDKAIAGSGGKTIVVMSSTSNRPGITKVKWLVDGHTIMFLGERRNSPPQVYSLDVNSGAFRPRTHHPTPVLDYETSNDGKTILFEADPALKPVVDTPKTERTGFVVDGQGLDSILLDSDRTDPPSWTSRVLYRINGSEKPHRIIIDDGLFPVLPLSMSPDGRYAVAEVFVRHVPAAWLGYEDRLLHSFIAGYRDLGGFSFVERYLLVDLRSGSVKPLIDSPKEWAHDDLAWAPDSHSLVLSNVHLPVDVSDKTEQSVRKSQKFAVDVKIPSLEIKTITDRPMKVDHWDGQTNEVVFRSEGQSATTKLWFEEIGGEWKIVSRPHSSATKPLPKITYEQGLNSPPKVWVTDSGVRTLLLDPNPQFAGICFGKEREITWHATDGHEITGGLYLPPDYVEGRRYPLVIQTHAYDGKQFWIDGPWASSFAAQPLAAQGIVVLQMGKGRDQADTPFRSTPMEASRNMAAFEGAIDYLDQQGIIDKQKVGILGFSRTVLHVAYTLTHSKYKFTAASLSDGFNGGYFEALAFPITFSESWAVNGGPPFGSGLSSWMKNSASFNMANVNAPVHLEGYSTASALEEWEWYSLLSQMKKPVEFVLFPRASHTLTKPAQRMRSQQNTVDWFSYWLQGYERPNPEDPDQYKRWEHLRELQDADDRQVKQAATNPSAVKIQ